MTVCADDVVTVNSGTNTDRFAVDDIERIQFGEDVLTFIEKSGKETLFEYDLISEITFDYAVSGIEGVVTPDVLPIGLEGAEVYSISGHKMNAGTLPRGVYVIRNGTKVTKFIKR